MATRRCRIKAVANVSVSRGRCVEKPRENVKLDERTSSNSSTTSDSQEGSTRETMPPESASDVTFVGKLPDSSSLNETLENVPVRNVPQNSANVSEPKRLEANDSGSTPVDTPSVVTYRLEQYSEYPDVQQSGNCDSKDVSLCNRTDEAATVSTSEHCCKTEEIASVRSGDSCATSAQKADATETTISAPARLPRKRMKPTVSLSLVNRKAKETPALETAQQYSLLNKTSENAPVCHLDQKFANVSDSSSLEANGNDCCSPVDTPSESDCHLTKQPGYADVQKSDNCDSKDVSNFNRTDEDITVSTDEHGSKTEESFDSGRSGDSCITSAQKIDTTETKIPSVPARLQRKRMKPTVSLSVVNRKAKETPALETTQQSSSLNETSENAPVSHLDQKFANVSDSSSLEANNSDCSTPGDTPSAADCDLTQHPRYVDVQQSDNCDNKDESHCNRTDKDLTASTGEHSSKTEESFDSGRSGDSCITSAQKIDTAETKIPSVPARLQRKRMKPTVSLSLVNRKAKETPALETTQQCSLLNKTLENAPVCHLDRKHANVANSLSLEANNSDCTTPVETSSEADSHLTHHPVYADGQQSDNCDSKDDSLCNRMDEDIMASTDERSFKTKESINFVGSGDSCATSAQKINTTETKIPSVPARLPRKRMKPTVSLSSLNKKVKENPAVENVPVCDLVQNFASVSETTCLEVTDSDHSTVDTPSEVDCHLAQRPGCADIQQSDNCDSKNLSLCNKMDEDITASTDEHSFKTEASFDSGRLGDSCVTSAQKLETTGTKILSAPARLPRKRMKPTVSLSLVNKKVKESPMVEITQHCNASKIGDSSTVQIPKKLQTIEASSDLHRDTETGYSGRSLPAVGCETPSSNSSCEVQKTNDPEFASQTCVEANVFQTTVCVPERKNGIAPDVITVDTSIREQCTTAVSVNTSICKSQVVSDSPAVGNDKGTSHSIKCSVNQSVKDCSQLNSFRSRFIRPKPLLESAARRNRTGSIGSASESDSEKKSLSSATTVSPPWQPRLKTSRTRLTHMQAVETDKLANASSVSTDESEDERSSISRAPTISPPKKIARLDSYGGSDTSHSEYSQELSEESSSPVKKPYTKPERVTKRKEYLRRIIEIKKEISHKVSDGRVNKSRLTMFDLIYYNPVTNPMKSVQEPGVKKSVHAPLNATENENRLAEESVDEPEALEDEERSSTVPVPQVKVGPNGEIILDEQSLVIETTDAKKNWNDLQNSEVIMDYGTGTTTFNAYSKKKKSRTKDWNREETLRFYRALHTVGTDFLVMQSLFPKFTRKDLKDRYKKEERINRELVEKALRNPLTFDLTELQKEFEVERLEEERRLVQPKKAEKPKRKGGSRRCSLFAALDPTDKGEVRSEGKKLRKRKIKEVPVKTKCDKPNNVEETHSKKKREVDNTRTPPDGTPGSDANNVLNGHVESESSVPEAPCLTNQVKPTRSGRIPRPRIFEDYMTDDVEEIYEETQITEICDRVTVEDVCDSEPVANASPSEHEELVASENAVADEDGTLYESENDDQNFVIAEDALTVQQNQVNLGSVYSNVKPGTLIVLATESPDNPGHQIFRVFMVSNNSETLPVSVANDQASAAGTTNSVEMGTSTDPVVSESSTNDCNSLQMSAETSS